MATGITEEILSRGFVLKRLYEESKTLIPRLSLLVYYSFSPRANTFASSKINGQMLLMFMVTDLLLSMVTGLIMIQRKSLTVPILIHAFYNIVVALSFI